MEISEALLALDASVDDHWTSDGAPRVDVVSGMVGRGVARAEITNVDPHFTRDTHPMVPAADETPSSPATTTTTATEATTTGPDIPVVVAPDFAEGAARYTAAGDAVAEAQHELEQCKQRLKDAMSEQACWAAFAPRTGYDHKADQESRMAVIRASTAARARRHAARAKVTGGEPVQAPIDQAMGRPATRQKRAPIPH